MPPNDGQQQLNPATGLPFAPNVQVTSPQVSTTQQLNTPERQQFADREQQAYVDQATAAKAGFQSDIDVARQQAEAMKAQAAKDEAYAEERERLRRESQWRYEDARRIYESKMAEAMKDPGGYWDNKTSLDRVMTRIAITMGAFGPGDNRALKTVNDEIEKDLKAKQIRSERLFKQAELAKGYAADALRAKAEDLADLDSHRAALWNIVAKRSEMIAKSGLAGKLTAEQQAKVAEIQNEAAKAGVKAQDTIAAKQTVEGPKTVSTYLMNQPEGGNKPTESEAKYAVLAKSVLDELADIEKMTPLTAKQMEQVQSDALRAEAADKTAAQGQAAGVGVELGRKVGLVPRSKYSSLPPEAQKVSNAYDNAGEKLFRILTGAGMPAEEARRMVAQALPNAGDTPDLAVAKHKRLGRTAEDMLAIAGVGARQRLARQAVQGQQPATAAPNPLTAVPKTKDEAIELARARLKANPNDARAKKFLDDNGVKP